MNTNNLSPDIFLRPAFCFVRQIENDIFKKLLNPFFCSYGLLKLTQPATFTGGPFAIYLKNRFDCDVEPYFYKSQKKLYE